MKRLWPQYSRELLVSRRASMRYGFDRSLFAYDGRVILADFTAARHLAAEVNRVRLVAGHPEQGVNASDINAAGLLHEAMHALIGVYRRQVNPEIFSEAIADLQIELGYEGVEQVLELFAETFPVRAVRDGEISSLEYLEASTENRPNREVVLEELLLLWLANVNPALASLRELFSDEDLSRDTAYLAMVRRLQDFFHGKPGLGEGGGGLIDLLRAPVVSHPGSLHEQLAFISRVWGLWVGDLAVRLLGGADFLAEEHRPVFPPGPGPVAAPSYSQPEDEAPEAFSADLDWMPKVVLLAKNTYVWLAQLSQEHGEEIRTLDQVPDAEFDRLANRGITGLWLIGVWERSRASAKIKQWMGDHDAAASAYSLYDYVVAADLGGEAAFEKLKSRAWQRGIRMTTDMVPNHVGIDGRWLVEHPDWFIGLPDCPFPAYNFSGKDLGDDQRVAVHIEDGYWDRTDAAVVFKRVDRWTGDTKYIYHGNDGTSMPWNDTAQLDYRKAEVREAVIQTILHVARLSPIIRFDAAMTLTRRNFQRLWFPEPGTGGDIPSRAGFGMSRQEFDDMMPVEFWREVVDRVAVEAPDTLLLAEAFWMLEGYFVRSLGMHRVYNSAFMNMLRDEKNDEYRKLIRNTLEYDPRILSRYVNFMSNPDEETAVEQFGRDDKYFGICTLMATMPGMPMFGHGQVEGFAEKYGMEFRRPRWQEEVNQGLLDRHEQQLFPLLRARRLFAEVDRFRLYDFSNDEGHVNEDVFAYSNEADGQRTLVVYHNRFAETAGWVHRSVPFVARPGDETSMVRDGDLAEGLGLGSGDGLIAFRDAVTGLEYLRSTRELWGRGLFAQLGAYELHVFMDFKELGDSDPDWWRVMERLNGSGAYNLDDERKDLDLLSVLDPWSAVLEAVRDASLKTDAFEEKVLAFVIAARRLAEAPGSSAGIVITICDGLDAARKVVDEMQQPTPAEDSEAGQASRNRDLILAAWSVARTLGFEAETEATTGGPATERFLSWRLGPALERVLRSTGSADLEQARHVVPMLLALEGAQARLADGDGLSAVMADLLNNESITTFIGVNRYEGRTWFHKERAEEFVEWFELIARIEMKLNGGAATSNSLMHQVVSRLRKAILTSEFDVDLLLQDLEEGALN